MVADETPDDETPGPAGETGRILELCRVMSRRTGGRVVHLGDLTPAAAPTADDVFWATADDPLTLILEQAAGIPDGAFALIGLSNQSDQRQLDQQFAEAGLHFHMVGRSHPHHRPTVALASKTPPPKRGEAPSDFRVLGVMTAYNEADILPSTLPEAHGEGLEIYLIDNWSLDGTRDVAAEFEKRPVIGVERFPEEPSPYYEWERLLRRVESVAAASGADWVVHIDADEVRRSPWPSVPLRDALWWVQKAGFTAIDHTVVIHPPTHNGFRPGAKLDQAFRYFELGRRPGHFAQIKAWRNTGSRVDLASSGGHDAQFPDRRVFPLNFVLHHYPIRSQEHGVRKVIHERMNRWHPIERARGWHTHYDHVARGTSFLRDPVSLTPYSPATFPELHFYTRLGRVGLRPQR